MRAHWIYGLLCVALIAALSYGAANRTSERSNGRSHATRVGAEIAESDASTNPSTPIGTPAPSLRQPSSNTPPPRPASPWRIYRSTSPMDGTPSVVLTSRAPATTSRYGQRYEPTLHIRCVENTTALIVDMDDEYLGIDDLTVEYRLDDHNPVTARWNISTSNSAVGLWRGSSSIPLIRQLVNAERFRVRFTPYGQNPKVITFNVRMLDEHLPALREACHW